MIPTMVPVVGMRSWRPQARLSQGAPAVVPARPGLFDIDGPAAAVAMDLLAAVSTGILGKAFGSIKDSSGHPTPSRWSTVFWVISGITGFKALIDISRFR
jgi:hypothetical protein